MGRDLNGLEEEMFNKLKKELDETKASFSVNVKEIVEQSKIMIFLTSNVTSLIVGFAMGSVVTTAMYKTINKSK